jgi:hypothetical protein
VKRESHIDQRAMRALIKFFGVVRPAACEEVTNAAKDTHSS